MSFASPSQAWTAPLKWVAKFKRFPQRMSALDGVGFNWCRCLGSASLCRQFLTTVANKRKGFSRHQKVISAERKKHDLTSLTGDASITKLIRGVETPPPERCNNRKGSRSMECALWQRHLKDTRISGRNNWLL